MFTIKKESQDGTLAFWEAPDFRVDARYPGNIGRPEDYPRFPEWDDRIMRFFPSTAGGSTELVEIEDGTIYVMNATGRTVDRFRLGNSHLCTKLGEKPHQGQGAGVSREETPIHEPLAQFSNAEPVHTYDGNDAD